MPLDPERHLAQIDSERVLVDGVEAVANHVAERLAVVGGCRFRLVGANDRELAGKPARGGKQEMSRTGRRIADFQR